MYFSISFGVSLPLILVLPRDVSNVLTCLLTYLLTYRCHMSHLAAQFLHVALLPVQFQSIQMIADSIHSILPRQSSFFSSCPFVAVLARQSFKLHRAEFRFRFKFRVNGLPAR